MTASHSITLADPAVNKQFITAAGDFTNGRITIASLVAERDAGIVQPEPSSETG